MHNKTSKKINGSKKEWMFETEHEEIDWIKWNI